MVIVIELQLFVIRVPVKEIFFVPRMILSFFRALIDVDWYAVQRFVLGTATDKEGYISINQITNHSLLPEYLHSI